MAIFRLTPLSVNIIRLPSPNAYRRLSQVISLLYRSLPPVPRTAHVVLVTHESLLCVTMSQYQLVLLHVLDLSILRYAFLIIVVIFFDRGWQKWSWQLLFRQFLPINLLKPRMVFDLIDPMIPKSCFRLSLDESVDKINTFPRPAKRRNFIQLDLLSQYFFPDFLSVLANIRSLQ